MTDFQSRHTDELDRLRNNVSEVNCVIVPYRRLDSFVRWCKSTDEITLDLSDNGRRSDPFVICADNQLINDDKLHLVISNRFGGPYEHYNIATQVDSPESVITGTVESPETEIFDLRAD